MITHVKGAKLIKLKFPEDLGHIKWAVTQKSSIKFLHLCMALISTITQLLALNMRLRTLPDMTLNGQWRNEQVDRTEMSMRRNALVMTMEDHKMC